MSGSTIKIPTDTGADYDFIAFSFNGKHSFEDFGIYRTSDGNTGYSEKLTATRGDVLLSVPGMDGEYYFGTQHKTKTFSIKFAFDSITETKLQEMRAWLSDKGIHDLWFAESPHKIYSAKVNGTPTIKALPYEDSTYGRIYKGTGTVNFVCYYPYAHTPRYVEYDDGVKLDGKIPTSYRDFSNYQELLGALPGTIEDDEIIEGGMGDFPFTFVADLGRPGYYKVTLIANNGTDQIYSWWQDENTVLTDEHFQTAGEDIFTSPVDNPYSYVGAWKSSADGTGNSPQYGAKLNTDMTFYAIWSDTCTISFYKALDKNTKDWWVGGEYTNHTGVQELYGCNYSIDGGVTWKELPTNYYRKKFTDTGVISTCTLQYKTKIMVWVKNDTRYKNTRCHITAKGLENKIMDYNPSYIFELTEDTHITFEWVTSGLNLYRIGESNWNAYIEDSKPAISGGMR